jgi:glutamate N-acetyltransferase / amino-acid N-acetyltransferase
MSDNKIKFMPGGSVTSPAGFKASGITAGLKVSGKPDMALIVSDAPAAAAGTFTTCKFAAAPVRVCQKRIQSGKPMRGVIVNSGNANACTGSQGLQDAESMCATTAAALGADAEEIFVSSTGRIGVNMPMDIIDAGITKAAAALDSDGGQIAAQAIMTTDTVPKSVAVTVELSGGTVTLGGTTKGAGMIDPQMAALHATMLCYITTDAKVEPELLNKMLFKSVDTSFNRINIDGDMSTNDTTLLFANGVSGIGVEADSADAELFTAALTALCQQLAREMVLDGEGVTKFVTVEVKGAVNLAEAKLCAEAIANSLLCKTAWFGCDPNWGRVVAAIGYSGASFDPDKVTVDYNDKPVVRDGGDAGTPEAVLAEELKAGEFTIYIDLNAGNSDYWVWTSDISYEYVKINAEYHT